MSLPHSVLLAVADALGENDPAKGLETAAKGAGYAPAAKIQSVIGNGVNVVFGLIGIGFLAIMVYAGVLYITANGKEDHVKKAKDMFVFGALGGVVIIGAYAATKFLISSAQFITGTGGG